ncbi:MAG: Holliday junction resolvase RuvX [Gammaproteobacteria bacterium]
MPNVLGFDFGMKRIGVAVGQEITATASPLNTLNAKDGIPNWNDISKLITEWNPGKLIVGLPLRMDGSEQSLTFAAKRFANRLHEKFKLPVELLDERLTSFEAEQRAREFIKDPLAAKKYHDSIAAQIILENWFAYQATRK